MQEAVEGKTVMDEFMPIVANLTYNKGVGLVGYAWQVRALLERLCAASGGQGVGNEFHSYRIRR
jgi:hypothetical protein